MENPTNNPSDTIDRLDMGFAIRLSKLLNVSLEWLLLGTGEVPGILKNQDAPDNQGRQIKIEINDGTDPSSLH